MLAGCDYEKSSEIQKTHRQYVSPVLIWCKRTGIANSSGDRPSPIHMTRTILLTSFTTWKPEQPSNSSDDLLEELLQGDLAFLDSLHFLRRLPVDFEQAPRLAIAHIQKLQPDVVVCCGMAETRDRLNLEMQAVKDDPQNIRASDSQDSPNESRVLKTPLDLPRLAADLPHTDLSYDAGRFVCNALYFSLLEQAQATQRPCLFVHVPILTAANRLPILQDFCQILQRLIHL